MASSADRSWRWAAVVVLALIGAAVWWIVGAGDAGGEVGVVAPREIVEGAEIDAPEIVGEGEEAEELVGDDGAADDSGDDDAPVEPPRMRPTGTLDLGVSGAFRDDELVAVGLRRVGEDVGIPFFALRPPQRRSVRRLEPGAYEVVLLPADDVRAPPLVTGQADVRADETTRLSLVYAPGRATLRVRLVGDVPWFDELFGEPDVHLRRPGAPLGSRRPIEEDWETRDGAEVMTIRDLAPGPRVVDVAPFGVSREVVLTDGATTDVDVRLDDLAWIVARPTDATGFYAVTWGFVGSDDAHVVPHTGGVAGWAAPARPIWVRAVGEQSSSDAVTLAPVARETTEVSLRCDRPGEPELTVLVTVHRHRHVLGRVFVAATEVIGPGRSLVSQTDRDLGLVHECLLDAPGTYTLRHVLGLGLVDEREVTVERDGINFIRFELPRR